MQEKYINPFTDFGFKKIFGEEANKDLLIDFLNGLLDENIQTLTFLKTEQLGATPVDRKAVFDLYCQNERGERFIVELQKARQKYFKERSLYYATFALQEQAVAGEWTFELNSVYSISIMDFVFDEHRENQQKFRHDVRLVETETNEVFNTKLSFVYLEMPKFQKTEDELETRFDKWMFVIKNLARVQNVPNRLQERIFDRLFEVAEIAKYNPQERMRYQDSIKYYRDIKNVIDTAVEQGLQEGLEKGLQEGIEQGIEMGLQQGIEQTTLNFAKKLKDSGEPTEKIAAYTGLSREIIENL